MPLIKLEKPIDFEGERITEINLDLDGLTGTDIINAEREASPMIQVHTAKELTKEFQVLIAARASKRPKELFLKLGARDFARVTLTVQNFFIGSESEVTQDEALAKT